MSIRDAAVQIAWSHMGEPYLWGGDDPVAGFDCSGFVQEPLRAVGILPRKIDYSADGLLTIAFRDVPRIKESYRLRPGMLVFWANPDRTMRHVEMVWEAFPDRVLTIGASGGGSKTQTREDAIRANAYVKVSPLGSDWDCAVDPFPAPF